MVVLNASKHLKVRLSITKALIYVCIHTDFLNGEYNHILAEGRPPDDLNGAQPALGSMRPLAAGP